METTEVLARDFLREISAKEPAITSQLINIATDNGGRLEGLAFRIKSEASLIRKIETDALLDEISLKEATEKINDGLRYTTILNVNTFGSDYAKMKASLSEAGFETYKVKNTWLLNGPYKGVNTIVKKDNLSFEIQYHTQESFDLKNGKLHELYEERRLPTTLPERRLELDREMLQLSKSLIVPNGIEGVD